MSPSVSPAAAPRFKRSARNYLLDKSFQLKYTGYIVGVATCLSVALGGLLYVQSEKTVTIAREAVQVGRDANRAGTEAVAQSKAVNDKVVLDAVMSEGPDSALVAALRADTQKKQDEITALAKRMSDAEQGLLQKSQDLDKQRLRLLITLGSALAGLVIALGFAAIVVTHKVVGPIFKMKRLLRDVGEGKLGVPGRLRRSDELQEFFDVFVTMVEKLRARKERDLSAVEQAIAQARQLDAPQEALERLETLRAQLQGDLERKAEIGAPSEARVATG